jgi:archaellum component FlaC
VPIKETEKRSEAFQQQHGINGAVELDALESLHPGELAKLLEQEILRFRDNTIEKRFRDKRYEIRRELEQKSKDVQKNHNMDELREEYDGILEELSDVRDAHDEIKSEFEDLEERYTEEVTEPFREWYTDSFEPFVNKLKEKFKVVVDELEEQKSEVDTFELPQASEIPLDETCLFDSKRAYIPQLAIFKQFAGKFGYVIEDDDAT